MKKNDSNKSEKSFSSSSINWFPGHMVKAMNEIKDVLKLIDIVIEVVDSRLPLSSRNYMIDELVAGKPRIIVMNKYDLADTKKIKLWKEYFEKNNNKVVFTNAQDGENVNKIISLVKELGEELYKEKLQNKKIEMKPIYRVAILGIPNVGKSTLINKLSKKTTAAVGNKPGVTLKKQWIRLADNIELMDTPGLLWPKLDENNAGIKLALTGNIKQEILDALTLAADGIKILCENIEYKEAIRNRYKLKEEDMELKPYEILEKIGLSRGCIVSKGEIDYERTSKIFLDELKNGKICKFILDDIN